MAYMHVVSQSDEKLHLARSPGIRAWSTFVGILAVGVSMMVYSGDNPVWKIFCLVCCLFVSVCSLDDWEECILDKNKGEVILKKFSLVEKMLKPNDSQRLVQASLEEISGVEVEQEDIRFFGRGKCVLLNFISGFSLPITEKCTLGSGKEHIAIADTIGNFLELEIQKKSKDPTKRNGDGSASVSSSSASEADCEESSDEEGIEPIRLAKR
ncbi:cytochrome b-245 chaperone 1-like [Amphiura filiformis]|uniref:cytochrome b-245 chaperone 1-like n=1 Tax=Amphiura filiformis TaxID=82378 RepID=UPI003B210CBB